MGIFMNINDNNDIRIKCVMLGDQAVGKTSLVNRYILDKFFPYSETTIGATYNAKPIAFENKIYKLDIWDTAGQERYRSMVPLYYRNADIVFICIDLSTSNINDNFRYWYNDLNNNTPENDNRLICLVGTKSDLKIESNDMIIQQINVNNDNIFYIETSAKENKNISRLFNDA